MREWHGGMKTREKRRRKRGRPRKAEVVERVGLGADFTVVPPWPEPGRPSLPPSFPPSLPHPVDKRLLFLLLLLLPEEEEEEEE